MNSPLGAAAATERSAIDTDFLGPSGMITVLGPAVSVPCVIYVELTAVGGTVFVISVTSSRFCISLKRDGLHEIGVSIVGVVASRLLSELEFSGMFSLYSGSLSRIYY